MARQRNARGTAMKAERYTAIGKERCPDMRAERCTICEMEVKTRWRLKRKRLGYREMLIFKYSKPELKIQYSFEL